MISTHTLRGERDGMDKNRDCDFLGISTHTLRGERDIVGSVDNTDLLCISTHTLRGERDVIHLLHIPYHFSFQLTRSAGSVTRFTYSVSCTQSISTHTLRGERDQIIHFFIISHLNFNSHAPRGA